MNTTRKIKSFKITVLPPSGGIANHYIQTALARYIEEFETLPEETVIQFEQEGYTLKAKFYITQRTAPPILIYETTLEPPQE